MIVDNRVEINKNKLRAIYKVVARTVDTVISQSTDGLLIKPKSASELNSFTTDIRTILTDKLRRDFELL